MELLVRNGTQISGPIHARNGEKAYVGGYHGDSRQLVYETAGTRARPTGTQSLVRQYSRHRSRGLDGHIQGPLLTA